MSDTFYLLINPIYKSKCNTVAVFKPSYLKSVFDGNFTSQAFNTFVMAFTSLDRLNAFLSILTKTIPTIHFKVSIDINDFLYPDYPNAICRSDYKARRDIYHELVIIRIDKWPKSFMPFNDEPDFFIDVDCFEHHFLSGMANIESPL